MQARGMLRAFQCLPGAVQQKLEVARRKDDQPQLRWTLYGIDSFFSGHLSKPESRATEQIFTSIHFGTSQSVFPLHHKCRTPKCFRQPSQFDIILFPADSGESSKSSKMNLLPLPHFGVWIQGQMTEYTATWVNSYIQQGSTTLHHRVSTYTSQFQSLCTKEFAVIPLNFLPANQKIIPQQEKKVMRAMLVRIGGMNPFSSAHGVKNFETPYPQRFLFLLDG